MSIVRVNDVSKIYRLYDSPIDRLKEAIHPFQKKYHKDFYALKNITFEVKKGDTLGLIGKNGSGKSTLLKIISGLLTPSSGNVKANGKISALLELGAGFNMEYTGVENIYLNGMVMGLTKKEIDEKLEDIISFADIGDFINQPVKTYSSGMFVRLAFSVATNVEPDILIVDEALSVGDMVFQARSMRKMKELIDKGSALLFVSHDISTVKSLCNKVIYLENSQIKEQGESGKICDLYVAEQNEKSGLFLKSQPIEQDTNIELQSEKSALEASNEKIDEFQKRVSLFRRGNGEAKVLYAYLMDQDQQIVNEAYYSQELTLRVFYQSRKDIEKMVIAMHIKNKNQLEIVGTNSLYEGIQIKNIINSSTYCIEFKFINYLQAGNYSFTIILADDIPTTLFFDYVNNAVLFKSKDQEGQTRWALVGLPMEVKNFLV